MNMCVLVYNVKYISYCVAAVKSLKYTDAFNPSFCRDINSARPRSLPTALVNRGSKCSLNQISVKGSAPLHVSLVPAAEAQTCITPILFCSLFLDSQWLHCYSVTQTQKVVPWAPSCTGLPACLLLMSRALHQCSCRECPGMLAGEPRPLPGEGVHTAGDCRWDTGVVPYTGCGQNQAQQL